MSVASRKPAEGVRAGLGKFWVQPDDSAQTVALGRMEVGILIEEEVGRSYVSFLDFNQTLSIQLSGRKKTWEASRPVAPIGL